MNKYKKKIKKYQGYIRELMQNVVNEQHEGKDQCRTLTLNLSENNPKMDTIEADMIRIRHDRAIKEKSKMKAELQQKERKIAEQERTIEGLTSERDQLKTTLEQQLELSKSLEEQAKVTNAELSQWKDKYEILKKELKKQIDEKYEFAIRIQEMEF